MTNRREFIIQISVAGSALATTQVMAQAMVAEADAAGGCPLFAGKQVAGKGWCSAWAKKA